jgi:hypothetical protein
MRGTSERPREALARAERAGRNIAAMFVELNTRQGADVDRARRPLPSEGGSRLASAVWRVGRQAFAAGVIDELVIAPVLLEDGEGLFEDVEDPGLEPVAVIQSPKATHVTYRIGR